jgi:type I restriction-modification system DNA methylase subunit
MAFAVGLSSLRDLFANLLAMNLPTDSMFEFDVRDASVDEIHARTAIYTASPVVAQMLDRIGWPREHNGSLLDPSCGDGSFLLEALRRLKLGVDDVAKALRVRGWEIHPGAVTSCRTRVAEFLVSLGWGSATAHATAAQNVTHADFLIDGPKDSKFDVIAGNPPYLRFIEPPHA